ncbi:sugar phosphate isomerase/epimerase family protein [Priestia koreensis]|uniref:sugar phosphate isomerase/epimerase family protein n=1 Tax=Priestia koreensis TaxID=284581 RepID=UPI001F5954CC|nr:sugar phosphate isomerase/epimerase [Priestia koreensis]MCM3003337.1 sugar phosphate isomerase/epimerase [Priestia koreensis]UNL86136.1 sugar phosphate isomerase/epimerase [Priestia koreensis]
MKLGVLTVLYQNLPFEEALDRIKEKGLQTIELGTGNYPGNHHCNPSILLEEAEALKTFQQQIQDRGLEISALSCHGNPLHPNQETAKSAHDTWRDTVLLAEKLGLDTINLFSGCPGDSVHSKHPNWVTCAWPPDYLEILDWQWNEQLIPYWKKEAAFAREHGVTKIAFEMHPGFMVYNPETLLRLREAVGPEIGANYDPSHLVWQGMDPVETIKLLGKAGAIFHVHAKDTYVDQTNTAKNGVLDTKAYDQFMDRSWSFRSVGYGMDEKKWKDIVSTLRMIGYDGAISIEHEDGLASVEEGFSKAVDTLKRALFFEKQSEIWWA